MERKRGGGSIKNGLWRSLGRLTKVVRASLRPLPTETGDGSYATPATETGLLEDLRSLDVQDVDTVIKMIKNGATGELIDDRTYAMEKAIQLASSLPNTSQNRVTLTNLLLTQLWNDLEHPPLSYLGSDTIYRAADGSNNSSIPRHIGQAGNPYAKSVQPQSIQPPSRPDPGVLFDSILSRENFKSHPSKISSMLFYLGSLIIHDLFRTDPKDPNRSLTSSYLDLAPLYGSNQEEQDTIRTFKGGKLKPDCFTDRRILGFPPGVGVLVIMFNRFHNHVVENLAVINENGRFQKPDDADSGAYAKYDNDLFQTGRLVTCSLYINLLLRDYVRTILNINRTDSDWSLDPRVDITDNLVTDDIAKATGNQISIEFNLVYRWHSCVSERDEKWMQALYETLFPNEDFENMSSASFVRRMAQWESSLPRDPQKRPFANLSRSQNGQFSDDGLVQILTESIEDCAGAFGARNVPRLLRVVEMLGIERARSWNLASLNEFRKHFRLTPYAEFEEVNSDPAIADQLRHLYDHPDDIELYPGLVVEDAKTPMVPGNGFCANFTMSRAILSDAVALVRADRLHTLNYTPKNLTNWGFKEVSYDSTTDAGHVFYKLFTRAFPHHFQYDSVYAHFPLVTPSENKKILTDLGLAEKYSWKRPAEAPNPLMVLTHSACKTILENKRDFKVTWGKTIRYIMQRDGHPYGKDFMLSGDLPKNESSRELMGSALYCPHWQEEVEKYYEKTTMDLLRAKSYRLGGVNQVDIVRDVLNIAQVHFCAKVFSLPLKTGENPHGVYSEAELYGIMALIFTCVFFDVDPGNSFTLHQMARKHTQDLGELVMLNVQAIANTGLLESALEKIRGSEGDVLESYGVHLIRRLLRSEVSPEEIVWTHLIPTTGGMVANQGQLISQCLHYYLSEDGAEYLPEIQRLAKLDTPEANDLLKRYFLEGARLSAVVALYRDVVTESTIEDGEKTLILKPGQRVVCNLVTASKDPAVFPEPDKVMLDRDLQTYIFLGLGPHQCLGYEMCITALTTMLKTLAKLDNLRRAPGPQGRIKKFPKGVGFVAYPTPDESGYSPFPTTMKVQWDGEI